MYRKVRISLPVDVIEKLAVLAEQEGISISKLVQNKLMPREVNNVRKDQLREVTGS